MKTIAPSFAQGRSKIDEHVAEVLEMMLDRQKRFSGVVSKINGTTTFIRSGDREFLAWSKPELTIGIQVEFTADQLQAVRVKVRKETPLVKPDEVAVAELPTPEPEPEIIEEPVEPEEESTTATMSTAFQRLFKS